MQKQNIIYRFLTVVAFVAFLGVGYLSTNIMTSCPAKAATCTCGLCTSLAGGAGMSLTLLGGAFVAAIGATVGPITIQITRVVGGFGASIQLAVMKSEKAFIDQFDTIWQYGLLPGMQDLIGNLPTTVGAMGSLSATTFQDAENQNRVKRNYQKRDLAAQRELRVGGTPGVAMTIAGGMTRASKFRGIYNVSAPLERLERTANALHKASASGSGADLNVRWNRYKNYYCNQDDNSGFAGCTGVTTPHTGEDLDVAGIIFGKETIDVTENLSDKFINKKRIVDDLIINLAEPFVKDPISAGTVNSDSATGHQAILQAEAYKAKRQVVYDALYHIVSRRVPGSKMDPFIREIREDAGIHPDLISDNASHGEIMQVMMSERFRSGRYGLSQIDEPENNQRELVIQQAFHLMQMSDQLDLMDRYALLLAAQVGGELKKSKPRASASAGASVKGASAP